MSYHVTIIRTTGARLVPIEREELIEAVIAGAELMVDQSKGDSLEITTAENKPDGPLLIWQKGEVWTKNPDAKTLQLMLNLAERLGARVRGDELETYITPEETYIHPEDKRAAEEAKRLTVDIVRRTRRRQWTVNIAITGTFVLLGLLVAYCSK